jgi:GT2 family glycosyltransferase
MDNILKSVAVIIVNWNTRELLRQCLSAVTHDAQDVPHEIIVVDNASSDDSDLMVQREFPAVRLMRNAVNAGHARANNQAIAASSSDYVLLLNSDAVVRPGCMKKLMEILDSHPHIGAVAAQSLHEDLTIQYPCRRLPTLMTALFDDTSLGWLFPNNPVIKKYRYRDWDQNDFRPVQQPELTCLLLRRQVFLDVGLFDERFFLYFNDPDFFARFKQKNLLVYYAPQAHVVHYGSSSIRGYIDRSFDWHRGRQLYYWKYFGFCGIVWVKSILLLDGLVRTVKLIVRLLAGKSPAADLLGHIRLYGRIIADVKFASQRR